MTKLVRYSGEVVCYPCAYGEVMLTISAECIFARHTPFSNGYAEVVAHLVDNIRYRHGLLVSIAYAVGAPPRRSIRRFTNCHQVKIIALGLNL